MDKFTDGIKKNLIDILKSNGYKEYKEIIDSPLRFYLVKMNNCINKEKDWVNGIIDYEHAYLKKGHIENETWQIKKEQLTYLMKTNWQKDVESIKNFKKDIQDLNELISQFQKSLKLTTSQKVLGLKSSCNIENGLKHNRFNFLKRH